MTRGNPARRAGSAARDPLAAARAGEHPGLLAKLRSGYVVLADAQYLPGHCILIADLPAPRVDLPAPRVDLPAPGVGRTPNARARKPPEHLAELPLPARNQFLTDLGLLGEALAGACAAWDPAFSRLDYEILGNRWRQLHAHVFPRYAWEPVEVRDGPVWGHPADRWTDPDHALGPAHERLVEAIARELSRLLAEAY